MNRRRNIPERVVESGILNFDSTLITLDVLKNHAHITISEKERDLLMIECAIKLLSVSIKYESFKADCEAEGINIAEQVPVLKEASCDNLLETFFGSIPLSKMRKNLTLIKQKLKEVRRNIA